MTKPQSSKPTKARKCPICSKPAVEAFKPFCSKRCADADLMRWLKGDYAIPGPPASEDELPDAESETKDTPPGGDPGYHKARN